MSSDVKVGLFFACGTALFWGLYGPTLGKSRVVGPGETPFKVYIFIGLAYLVWGIIGGIIANKVNGGNFTFAGPMIKWGFLAGSLGAFGALCLTFAMFKAKNAGLVMPIVFGGATTIAAIVSAIQHAEGGKIHFDPRQIFGFVMVVVGVVLIQMYTSHGPAPKPAGSGAGHAAVNAPDGDSST